MFESQFNKDNWHREAKTIAIRNAIRTRRWGMRVTVYDDPTPANNGDYVLSYNLVDTNRQNNANWLLVADIGETWGGGGGGGAATPVNEYFAGDGVEDEFTIADADGLIQFVEVGGQLMQPGVDYAIAGPLVTFTSPPANGIDIGVYYWNDVTVVDDHFLGVYVSLAALQAAHPTANAGDYADVDAGPGSPAQRYIWDVDDAEWVLGSNGANVLTYRTLIASHTLDATDLASINAGQALNLLMDVAIPNTVTIPPDSTVDFPIGTSILVDMDGVGQTSFLAGVGVIIDSANGWVKIAFQYSGVVAKKTAANRWRLQGTLTA